MCNYPNDLLDEMAKEEDVVITETSYDMFNGLLTGSLTDLIHWREGKDRTYQLTSQKILLDDLNKKAYIIRKKEDD